MLIKVKVRS